MRARIGALAVAAALLVGCVSSGSASSTGSTSADMLAYGHAHHTASHHPGAAAKEMVTVPQVVGEKFNDAVHEITRAGLRQDAPGYTGTIGNPHYNGNCKRVLSQAPRAGTRVPKEAMVAIVYGVCPHAIANGHHSLKSGG